MDLDAMFDALDREIEELAEARAGCRRSMIVSRVAIIGGLAVLVFSLPLPDLRNPVIAFGALAAAIGGMVWAGASKASGEDLDEQLAAAELRKASLIDRVAVANGWRDVAQTIH